MKFFHRTPAGDTAWDEANLAAGNKPVVEKASIVRTPSRPAGGDNPWDGLGAIYAALNPPVESAPAPVPDWSHNPWIGEDGRLID